MCRTSHELESQTEWKRNRAKWNECHLVYFLIVKCHVVNFLILPLPCLSSKPALPSNLRENSSPLQLLLVRNLVTQQEKCLTHYLKKKTQFGRLWFYMFVNFLQIAKIFLYSQNQQKNSPKDKGKIYSFFYFTQCSMWIKGLQDIKFSKGYRSKVWVPSSICALKLDNNRIQSL